MARNSTPPAELPPSLIKATPVLLTGAGAGSVSLLAMIPAMGVSAGLHVFMVVGFALVLLIGPSKAGEGNKNGDPAVVAADDDKKDNQDSEDPDFDPTNPFVGDNKAGVPFPTNDSQRLADNTIDGETRPDKAVGTPEGDVDPPAIAVPRPPGMENLMGTGKGGLGIGDMEAGIMGLNVGGSFAGRSAATKAHLIEKGGGNAASEAAVALGLKWFASHQSRDGYFAMDNFQDHISFEDGKEVAKKCNCEGGALHDNIAGTAFALLPFLGAGLTPDNAKKEMFDYTKQIEKGLQWLAKNQQADGRFVDKVGQDNEQYSMYNHGIATICMCEAASLYPKSWVRASAQAAINCLVALQEPNNGGWRYGPSRQAGDTSVVGWCVMALQSGRLAGLNVPPITLERAKHFLDLCETQTPDSTTYGYTDKNGGRTTTAVGLLCRMYLGWKHEDPRLVKGWRALKTANMPDPKGQTDLYFQYYATQVMHHMGGDPDDKAEKTKEFREGWKEWNQRMRDMLIEKQDQGKGGRPHQQGSWTPTGDQWCSIGGRVMMTSLCLLTLEVYYRHLPLYRTEQTDK